MPSNRLYIHRTPSVERALSLVTEVAGVADTASVPQKLEAWIAFSTHHVEDEIAYEARVEAYEELASVEGRHECAIGVEGVKGNARARPSVSAREVHLAHKSDDDIVFTAGSKRLR